MVLWDGGMRTPTGEMRPRQKKLFPSPFPATGVLSAHAFVNEPFLILTPLTAAEIVLTRFA
jgi:hypothetical protein